MFFLKFGYINWFNIKRVNQLNKKNQNWTKMNKNENEKWGENVKVLIVNYKK